MYLLDQNELKQLMENEGDISLSLYMPTYRAGADVQQNPIRFKNLLRQAEEELVAAGLEPAEVRGRLTEAHALQGDYTFWQHQFDGLALFSNGKQFNYFRLPLQFEEKVLVSRRFHVRPLLPMFIGDGRFYILALSQSEVRLLQGTRDSVAELDPDNVPGSLSEALWFDDPEAQLQHHVSVAPGSGRETTDSVGRGPAMFHGHGVSDEDELKERLLRYFQKIDDGLSDLLSDEQAPLVLAGVEYLFPIYHQANSYQYLLDEGVSGNPDELSAAELHRRTWEVVEPHFQEVREEAVNRYQDLLDTERVSTSLETIVPAAHYGRVEAIFVPLQLEQWGRFNPDTAEVEIHPEQQPGDTELYDLAAVQTLQNSGVVFTMDSGNPPGDGPIAAIFRY